MAYDFNGSSQYLSVGSAVLTAVPLTMACWFNSDSTTTTQALVAINGNGSSGTGETRFAMVAGGALSGDPVAISAKNTSGTDGLAQTSTGYSANTWTHAAGVFTSNTSRTAYINGGNTGTNSTSVTPNSLTRTVIGASNTESGVSFYANARIAEVGIWNVALSAAEIASLADGMKCNRIRPASLVFYAPLVRNIYDYENGVSITNNNSTPVATHTRVY